ncbi:MAG: hypothetical protein FWE48_07900 [Coriobacteriia bacterium]|nr:hypothetical protein [Coriobacteriia bacterium]
MKLLTSDTLDLLIEALGFSDDSAERAGDSRLKTYCSYVHVLEAEISRILEMNPTLKLDDLCYSAYYWFTQYKEQSFYERYTLER